MCGLPNHTTFFNLPFIISFLFFLFSFPIKLTVMISVEEINMHYYHTRRLQMFTDTTTSATPMLFFHKFTFTYNIKHLLKI